jgi:hypothetical protein
MSCIVAGYRSEEIDGSTGHWLDASAQQLKLLRRVTGKPPNTVGSQGWHRDRRAGRCGESRTDGWQGYAPLKQHGYDHRPTTQGVPKEAATLFPRVHRVFTHLKTWLWGTHRGVSRKHLPHYLNEFVFRFNRRRTPMAAFHDLQRVV